MHVRPIDDHRPLGIPLSVAPDGESLATAEIDLDRLAEVRKSLPALANRRDSEPWPIHCS